MRHIAAVLSLAYLIVLTTACTTREAVIGTGALAAGAAVGYIAADDGVGQGHDNHDRR